MTESMRAYRDACDKPLDDMIDRNPGMRYSFRIDYRSTPNQIIFMDREEDRDCMWWILRGPKTVEEAVVRCEAMNGLR